MLSSITPVGEHGRGQRWSVTAASFVLGATTGGVAIGALLGLASVGIRVWVGVTTAAAVLVAIGVVGTILDLRRIRPPGPRRQVDERWLATYRGWVYGAGYGIQLGAGITTIVASSATWLVLAAAALSGSAAQGALIGGVFGLVRALPVLTVAGVRSPADLQRRFRVIERLRQPVARAVIAVQATLLAGLVVAVGAT